MNEGEAFHSASLSYVEALYARYLEDRRAVADDWRAYFDGLHARDEQPRFRLGPRFEPPGLFAAGGERLSSGENELAGARLQERVDRLVRAYRFRGHMHAELDPLGRSRPRMPELDPAYHDLGEADLDEVVSSQSLPGPTEMTVREILDCMRNTYCRSIGVEYMHIDDLEVRSWLERRMEGTENRLDLPRAEQLRILTRLTDATIFEEFVRKKYVGAKTFSLEGAESLIPLLDLALEEAGGTGLEEIVIGMAHRGRLNVLANILGKRPGQIFREFEDVDPERYEGRGDVKYHLGYSSEWTTRAGESLHLSLCFNPSHLEFVNPVVLGRVRAKRDRGRNCLALLIHGDASFAGEGVVQETLNLSQLDAYGVGGAVHVLVNNQIGFTTPPEEGRSATYATDVAKMLQTPIFHVNGENPEAVAKVVKLAMTFRQTFERDVFIDMYCYRRHGHNEADEPAFTQPLLYEAIEERKSVRDGYLDHLLKLGQVSREEADRIARERREQLEEDLEKARSETFDHTEVSFGGSWNDYVGGPEPTDDVETGVPVERLSHLLESQTEFPPTFSPHRKIVRGLENRRDMAAGERPLDWGAAEALALATLAVEGHPIRLSGEDSERGTFSHRHAVLHDVETGETYVPLAHLTAEQAPVRIHNSPLSEAGVLGFEYGYSLDCPEGLVVWEAQFGDFANAGQVIIDQFISSAEDKWRRLSGLVLLLPHGFEGQGPEHSSARLERFLTLAAEDNLQVVNPTTPAQFFHCLRRQVLRSWRKPLVVLSPKSLLRHPRATSSLDELATGRFRPVLAEESEAEPERILLCSGKVAYDLMEAREEADAETVSIVRLEQLYPLPRQELDDLLAGAEDVPVFWVQEEPENMGAWPALQRWLRESGPSISVVARPPSASPATGSKSSHKLEQKRLVRRALGLETSG